MDKQTHKDVIQVWYDGVQSFDKNDVATALQTFLGIEDPSAKILFNIGHVELGQYRFEEAEQNFTAAAEKDPHMALAHFQLGMVNYRLHRYNESRSSYEKAKDCLRGNKFIDYRQLGFVHKLYECEVLYNFALTYATMMNNSEYALELLEQARKVAVESRHAPLIEKAQTRLMNNQLYEPLVLPNNQLFRPPQSKVAGLKNVDYLGKAKVVSELPKSELPESTNNNNETSYPKTGVTSPPGFRPIDDDFSDDEEYPSPGGNTSPTPSMIAKMTHKDTIAMWYEGVQAFERGDPAEALNQLNGIIDPSAKILYSIGILQKSLGQLDNAYSTFTEVVSKDPHLAIGHFQQGIVLGLLAKQDDAWHSFEKAHVTLRGNKMIDYKQLGLQYKLHKCEILHNQAWTYHELGQEDWARKLLDDAMECKADPRHDKMDDSYRNFSSGRSFKLYDLPKALLFKPPKSKIDNLERKDYLGKAKIVAKLPTIRKGSSTPPPRSSNGLGVPVLTPRSKTPTPTVAPPKAGPPPISKTQHLSSLALPSRPVPTRSPRPSLPETQSPWKTHALAIDTLQSSRPSDRPLPPRSHAGGFNPDKALPETPGENSEAQRKLSMDLPPSRALPSPTRLSPVPQRSVPQNPGRRASSDLPPSRPLPSPTRTSPVPERVVPQRPVPVKSDGPPSRALPSPNRTSPLQDRALPPPPGKSSSPGLPERPVPLAPKISISDIPNRPPPASPRLERSNLADRPVPPKPTTNSSESSAAPNRALPPTPGSDEPDLPSRPVPAAQRSGAIDLYNRPVPPSPNAGRKLPSRPGPPTGRTGSSDLPNRPTPALPSDEPSEDLPSRPVPPPPRPVPSSSSSSSEVPNLPARPGLHSESKPPTDNLPSRPIPPAPASKTSGPELPARPKTTSSGPPKKPLPGGLRRSGSPLPDRPVPPPPGTSNKKITSERRSSSPGLPDLPPPPPPQRGPSPVPERRALGNSGPSSDKKSSGHKAKLVLVQQESPPVIRRAAQVNIVHAEEKPSLPSRPGAGSKPTPASNRPPILAFKPEPKKFGGGNVGLGQAAKRKTALVIAAHKTDVEGEISVSEGDLITITGEDGKWLLVEVKGHKGRIPRSCVKDFSKPDITL